MTTTVRGKRIRWGAKALALGLAGTMLAAACGSDSNESSDTTAGPGGSGEKVTLRLGYFPNVTHGPAVYGIQSGGFAKDLGSNVELKPAVFNAGPNVVTALLSGSLDASFIGPGPAISAFTKDAGVVVAGVASGGAFLVVDDSIKKVEDLKGKKISSPQLNNTQDIALRWYLKEHGYKTDTKGGGDVNVIPQENSQTLTAFKTGDINGAWVPEPNATRMIKESGGHVLVDERDEWPDGKYVTTVLVVSNKFLKDHPDTVKQLIQALSNSIDAMKADPTAAAQTVADGITKAATKPIKPELVADSYKSITFTLDPIASSLYTVADHQAELGLTEKQDLNGIFDLTILNEVLKAAGKPEVTDK